MDHNAHIPALPVELITSIFGFVDSKTTLRSVALCSTQFYDIVTPYLYERVEVFRRQADENPNVQPYRYVLRQLLVLILQKPRLAAHVQHFAVRPYFVHDDDEPDKDPRAPPKQTLRQALAQAHNLEDILISAIEMASQSKQEHVKFLEDIDVDDTLISLLIPQLPNLKTLDIEMGINILHPICLERTLRRIAKREKPFKSEQALSNLHSFVWAYSDSAYGGAFTDTCFILPKVKSVFLHRIGSDDGDDLDEKLARVLPRSSACTHLEIKECRLNDSDTKRILEIPKELSTFIYEISWGHIAYCMVSFGAIREAMECQKDSLENIWLSYPFDGIDFEGDADENSMMESLKAFPKLRNLHIAPDFIFGACLTQDFEKEKIRQKRLLDFLPPSLEILHIAHGDEFCEVMYKGLTHLLQNKDRLPALRSITLETSMTRTTEDYQQLVALDSLSKSVGLPIRFINNWGDKKYQDYDNRIERKWGVDEDIVWMPCGSNCNKQMVYELMELDEQGIWRTSPMDYN